MIDSYMMLRQSSSQPKTDSKSFDFGQELLMESLAKNGSIYLPNMGAGMRFLIQPGDFLRITLPELAPPEIGRLLIYRTYKMFFGGRILAGSAASGWRVKSDCGHGESILINHSDVIALVDAFQIDHALFPLWGDRESQEINRSIARLSDRIIPQPSAALLRSGKVISMLRRKLLLYRLRSQQTRLRHYLQATQSPVATQRPDGGFEINSIDK